MGHDLDFMTTPRSRFLRLDDPDETEGRALYRAKAETLARAQMNIARRSVKMAKTKHGRKPPKPKVRPVE